MKLKGVLLAGAAIAAIAVPSAAEARSDRLTVYEIHQFVTNLTNAVNNPNPDVTRTFLKRNVDRNASFNNTINNGWAAAYGPDYIDANWAGYYGYSYYRYPFGYNAYVHPTSFSAMDKTDLIESVDSKKGTIPRYHQSVNILGTRMPADASSAVLDVELREFGLGYGYGYGYSYGYHPYNVNYAGKFEHATSRCKMNLKKTRGHISLTGMTCNTVMQRPFL